jgi:hypothetical protein
MMTITGAANENGFLVATKYMELDDLTGLAPAQLSNDMDYAEHESGTLLPGAYGGSEEMLRRYTALGGYGPTDGAYGGLLESGKIDSSSMVESLPEVEVQPSIPATEQQASKPMALTIQAATPNDAAATATASGKSAAAVNSVTAPVVLMAMAMVALAL